MSCREPALAILIILIAACLSATACTPQLWGYDYLVESRWGEAYDQDTQAQIAHPEGPASLEGPEGIDASTAERVAKRYYKGQEAQGTRRARAVVIGGAR
jgi:hypothetical protein